MHDEDAKLAKQLIAKEEEGRETNMAE